MADRKYRLRDLPSMPRGKRLSFFWEYYRFHTLALLIALLLIGLTIRDFATRVDPDFSIGIVAGGILQEEADTLDDRLDQLDLDVNGDGQTSISVQLISAYNGSIDYYGNMQLVTAFAGGEFDLVLLDEASADALQTMGALAAPDGTPAETIEQADQFVLPDSLQPENAALTAYRTVIPNMTDELLAGQSRLIDALRALD